MQSRKQLIKSKSGLRIVNCDELAKSPFLIQEPLWTPDKEISHCTKCKTKFGFTTRKHHCRRCGQIFCNGCCDSRLELQRMCFIDPVRVCLDCEPQTKFENIFFDKHIKTLTQGAKFIFGTSEDNLDQTTFCKLTQDHRYLTFDGIKIDPVEFINITALRVNKDPVTGVNQSLDIEYLLDGEICCLFFGVGNDVDQRNTSHLWITAIKKAYNLLIPVLDVK